MASQEEIDQQEQLLITHRRTLDQLLRQAAQHGGEAFAPPITTNGIYEARRSIARVKAVLRSWNVAVDDHPDDGDAPHSNVLPDKKPPSVAVDQRTLREAITLKFSMVELATLCADIQQDLADAGVSLRVDLDDIGGSSKEGKILELIKDLDRRGYVSYLVDAMRRARSGII